MSSSSKRAKPVPGQVDGVGDLTIRFWGTRGSLPIPGAGTVLYGGNTCCVEVRLGDRLFIVDAGSGFEPCGRSLVGKTPERVDVLLSHLHHDHILGLPFFAPGLFDECALRLHCGNLGGESPERALNAAFSPPLFPIRLGDLPPPIDYVGFQAGETLVFEDGIEVATCPLRHPGGATGYRFDYGGRRVCYVCDIEHDPGGPDPAVVRFCEGADLVIYDTMFTEAQYPRFAGWGHSTWNAGVELCHAAGAHALAGFHHHKCHLDPEIEALEAKLAAALPGSFMAREGQLVAFQPRVLHSQAAE